MKTLLKITLVSFAVLTINSAVAQNALQSRDIKKADTPAAKAVSAQPAAVEKQAGVKQAATGSEIQQTTTPAKQETTTAAQPAEVKEVKTPAQMAKQPLKRQVIYNEKSAATKQEEK